MSEQLELQAEEREALQSIYEGDTAFKQIDNKTFQYKYGEDDKKKSFLVEIRWGDNYPIELPVIYMDTFYNRDLVAAVKERIQEVLIEEAQQWLGCGMTYTLFECLKDRLEELTADQPEAGVNTLNDLNNEVSAIKISDDAENVSKKKDAKKEQLTKAQKRRQWDNTDHKGERPRGWNWVDIVKHLSQTGHKEELKANTGPVLEPLNI